MRRSRLDLAVFTVLALVASGLLLFVFVMAREFIGREPDPLPFDSEAWKAELDGQNRYRMALGLVKGARLIGLTELEVEGLLGNPTYTSHFGGEGDVAYQVKTFLGGDFRLVLWFADDGRVERAEVGRYIW